MIGNARKRKKVDVLYNVKLSAASSFFVFLFTLPDSQCSHYFVKKNTKRLLLCSTHLPNGKEWESCLILINLISHLIQTSALPARPSPGDSGKPHGATTCTGISVRLIPSAVQSQVFLFPFADYKFFGEVR